MDYNKNNNQSVIDWILQLDSDPPTTDSQSLVTVPQLSSSQQLSALLNDAPSNSPMLTKSDLFQFYLGDEVNQQQQQQVKRSAQTEDDKQSITFQTIKRTKKVKSTGAEPFSGRLDFRPTMTEQVPESQLKAMSPRERRQLRNKISARNFRNRRKEYISTLEEELDEYKSINKKLRGELTNVKDKMIQLENENKQLRLDLILYEQGINPSSKHHNSNNNNNTGTLSSFEISPDTTTLHALSSLDSSASPPDLNVLHDFTVTSSPPPQQEQEQQDSMALLWSLPLPDFNLNDMYLSHAMMPDWNVNHVLSKSNEQSLTPTTTNVNDTFRRFPLLAPALMSIVVGHTMTLSTNDLLTLNASTPTPTTTTTTTPTTQPSPPSDKQALKIWELLQPPAQKSITYISEKNHDVTTESTSTTDDVARCYIANAVSVLHRYLKNYVCASVQNYLEHCQLESRRLEEVKRPRSPICQKLQRAKERFIPVS
ncbi:hypothetical protein BC941DRAFT_508649 [Chlamydoabsidia padenii]|nr:hypothetical protein BC941DRAFT_508649 [Chlamydoabsidia padenii]